MSAEPAAPSVFVRGPDDPRAIAMATCFYEHLVVMSRMGVARVWFGRRAVGSGCRQPPQGELLGDRVDRFLRPEHGQTPVVEIRLGDLPRPIHLFDIGVTGHRFGE